jgi:hypothetical protein
MTDEDAAAILEDPVGGSLFPVTQGEHGDDVQDEHAEPDIPGTGSVVRTHGGAVALTVTR